MGEFGEFSLFFTRGYNCRKF